MSEISGEPPECPECGASWDRAGPYWNLVGALSDMKTIEAVDEYYRNREQYDDRSVRKFTCGHYEVLDDK